jgi:hypothetical protein
MLKCFAKCLAASAIALASLLGSPAQAGTIVVPTALSGTEGDSNNQLLNATRPPLPQLGGDSRIQQIFNANQFGGSTVTITGITFRPDGVLGTVMASTNYDIQISAGTINSMDFAFAGFDNNYASLSNTANLVGSRNLVTGAFGSDESRNVSSSNTGPVGGPKAFDIFVPFTSNYVYNPANGNLFLDITSFSTALGQTSTIVDADNESGVLRSLSGASSGSGTASDIGLVIQFQTLDVPPTPIPEPGTVTLFGLGMAGLVAAVRRRGRKGAVEDEPPLS